MAYSLEKRTENSMAQGCTGTNSKRPSQYTALHPKYIVRGEGPYIYDHNQNKYVDFVCSLGANILGHQNPAVNEAVKKQLNRGVLFSMASPLEMEAAEKIVSIVPSIEKVRFLKSGSEACSAALRFARAAVDVSDVASGGYHGWHDEFTSLTEPAAGVCGTAFRMKPLTSTSKEKIAIIEPLALDASGERRKEVERIASNHILINDEIITGMRVPELTVSRWWNIDPAITCLGKAIANGFPLAVVGGKEYIMDNPDVFVSSTYSGDCVSLAACVATINQIQKKNIKDLWYYANRFQDNLNDMTSEIGVELKGYGTRGMFDVTNHNTALFLQEAARAGIFMGKAFFYNFAHMEYGVDEWVLNALGDVVNKIRNGKVALEGQPPQETFVR